MKKRRKENIIPIRNLKAVQVIIVFSGPLKKLIEMYLLNRKQYVVFDDINSQVLDIKSGFPQATILGTVLFLICIKDIGKSSSFLQFILFADDTTIIAPINTNNMETVNIVNMELAKIITWLKLNKLSLMFLRQNYVYFTNYNEKYRFRKYRSKLLLLLTQKW